MSRPFAKYSAKSAFAQLNKSQDASDYILKKKIKYSFCNPNLCHPNKNIYSQSNYLYLKEANKLAFYPCVNNIDKTQLYINLITKLNLTEINAPIITNLEGNYPVAILSIPQEKIGYIIDPSGILFGNTVCGLTNYNNYVEYNPPYSTSNPGSISNL
jgi:hypothetical protein